MCPKHKPTKLAHSFFSVLMSISAFVALSPVFHSLNSPDNSPHSHSVLVFISLLGPFHLYFIPQILPKLSLFSLCSSGFFLPYWSFQVYTHFQKSPELVSESRRVCRALRSVWEEEGILEIEVPTGCGLLGPTHLFGPDFS